MDGSTSGKGYAQYLARLGSVWWKRLLPVQAPYRWNLRRMRPGFTLDIGCGYGRNLAHLDGNGVGVDHNEDLVAIARRAGLNVFTVDAFQSTTYCRPDTFDSILLSHVAEHMGEMEVIGLLERHLPLLKRGGKVIFITPQEAGHSSDPTHVQFMDFDVLRRIARALRLTERSVRSFPLPRCTGRYFRYNEFIFVCVR